MASIARKREIYHVRFRYQGKEYKKSLKTRDRQAAEAGRNIVELTIHRLLTGQIQIPNSMDPGEFILRGGNISSVSPIEVAIRPSTRSLSDLYLESVRNRLAPSYWYSQAMHLRHFLKYLGNCADQPCDRIRLLELDQYLQIRLSQRHPCTAERERISLIQFYKWVVIHGYLTSSPASGLAPIKGGNDRAQFRTLAEISETIQRGGLDEEEVLELWECLYLNPREIANLLTTVRNNAKYDYSFLLHAIPAYTGMRRGEVLRLRWSDIDLHHKFLIARSRKQSRQKHETARRIDLHPELQNELESWRRIRPRGQFVISDAITHEPINNDRANRCFWQPMRHTEWCLSNKRDWFKVGFHTYRHSFASNLAAAGVDQRIIDEFMGHQTEAMRKRYRHLFPSLRASAIRSFTLMLDDDATSMPQDAAPAFAENIRARAGLVRECIDG